VRLRRIIRSSFAFWLATAVLAVATAAFVAGITGRARAATSRFGDVRLVAVARHRLEPGDVITEADVERKAIPTAFLPRSRPVGGSPVGCTVVVPLLPGEPIVTAKVAPHGLRGAAALLPPHTRAVAVPTGAARPPLRIGDLVDVLATVEAGGQPGAAESEPSPAAAGEPTVVVAAAAVVVAVDDDAVTVAVDPEEALRVAWAAVNGALTLALVAPSG
jgi:Flp pilus assembly protein CpaB